VLYVRQDATVAADSSGDPFQRNQVQLRYEDRYGFGCCARRRSSRWT
jgi:hypothetical protein